jgi:hypothetical protein
MNEALAARNAVGLGEPTGTGSRDYEAPRLEVLARAHEVIDILGPAQANYRGNGLGPQPPGGG